MRWKRTLRTVGGTIAGFVVACYTAYLVFVVGPNHLTIPSGLAGYLIFFAIGFVGVLGALAAHEKFSFDDIAVVEIDHKISSDAGAHPGSDEIVDAIEDADDDDHTQALLVNLDTPGGEPVASDDIRRAIEEFDGPTVATCGGLCASGGYLIACACDRIYAREMSRVGSIGVIASRHTFESLVDRLGGEYHRLVGGDKKDAGMPTRGLQDDEASYLQGIVDETYTWFVERVAERRPVTEADILATEARIFTGRDAWEKGLVDEIGTESDAHHHLEEQLGIDPDESTAEEVTPGGFWSSGASSLSYRAASGAMSAVSSRVGVSSRSTELLKR